MTTATPPSAAVLDSEARFSELDPGHMYEAITAFPAHLLKSITLSATVDWSTAKPTTPAGICLCGMGGSAIGGDLARSFWQHESPIPFVVHRGYDLPAHINDHWFVIASSYSGNTEETLAAVEVARSRGCRRILAVTSGGELARVASESRWPCILLPGGLMPRAALGYLFGSAMMALANWGVSGNNPRDLATRIEHEIETAVSQLESRVSRLGRTVPLIENPAKQAAAIMVGKVILVWGVSGATDVIATRFKTQLCENGKAMAFANSLTELAHNEVVGITEWRDASRHAAVVLLQSPDDPVGAVRQGAAIRRQLESLGIPVGVMSGVGETRLSRMLTLTHFGDFLSYYVAILSGVDPTPIDAITALKETLSK